MSSVPVIVLTPPIAFFNLASVEEFGLYDIRSQPEWEEGRICNAMFPVDPEEDENYGDRPSKVLIYGGLPGKELQSSPAFQQFMSEYLPRRNKSVRELHVSEGLSSGNIP